MNLIGYTRVSSKSQEDNTSLSEQQRQIEEYCRYRGYCLVDTESDVFSGENFERPGWGRLQRRLADCDGIIVAKMDRICRSASNMLSYVDNELNPTEKRLIILNMGGDTVDTNSPTGRMFLGMLAVMAEYERMMIRERVSAGREANKRNGKRIGGPSPYGYQAEGAILRPVEAEQKIIQKMKRWRRDGASYETIADRLNALGVPSKKGHWHKMSVFRTITNKHHKFTKWTSG